MMKRKSRKQQPPRFAIGETLQVVRPGYGSIEVCTVKHATFSAITGWRYALALEINKPFGNCTKFIMERELKPRVEAAQSLIVKVQRELPLAS